MGEFIDLKGIIAAINTNSDEKISQQELQNAQGKVPSLWLEKITALAKGQDLDVQTLMTGLQVEPGARAENSETFHKENYFDYYSVEDTFGAEVNVPNLNAARCRTLWSYYLKPALCKSYWL